MISKALTGASTKPIVLAILKRGESYGYEIIQQVREITGGALEWSEPMLYPFLKRLERDGLIKSQWRLSEIGPLRKYYRLTELGLGELEAEKNQWLTVHSALVALWAPVPEGR
ncbi:MAG: helix-turn-helix transcriptional regulator [Candidatus Aminicenantes bacterium]|nr:helix-turn-helix transcriptional regulator [Candidatus Aminicenantes bacterium]